MRFLSYFLLFIVAVSVPSAIRAQHHDNALHINAVHLPFMIADANTITHTTDDDNNNQNTLQSGTLIAPTLVYSQADHDDSPIVSSLTSPMLIAVDAEGEAEGDEDGLEGESLMIDYQNDDRNTIELFSGINEELQENGAESLLESMDTEDMMIASQGDDDDDNNDDDIDSFHIAAAEGESSADGISKSEAESHLEKERKLEKARRPYRSLRRGFLRRAKGLRRFAPSRRIRQRRPGGKRFERMLKLMVLSKKLKALDMKMNLMKLLSRAIQMRLMEKGMGRGLGMMQAGRGMLMLRSLRNRMIKRLMVLKMIKLMHLLYQSTLGLPVYHRSGFRLSPRFLLRHILRHAYRHPTLARILMGLRLKSLTMRSIMKSFLNNLKFLLKKVYLLKKKGMMAAGNQHRLFVKADRAIVNVGDGNEFKPVFYRSRAAPRVSIDDSNIPLRITVPAPGIIRRVFTGRTEQERRSDY